MEGWFWLIGAALVIGCNFGEAWGWSAFFVLGFVGWLPGDVEKQIKKLRKSLEPKEDE